MVSAWDVYWVMQLDSIGSLFEWIAWVTIPAIIVIAIAGGCASDLGSNQTDDEKALWAATVRWMKRCAVLSVTSAAIASFLPSTKTAAAMVVLPAIANNQALQHEASELYDLAKRGLRKAVTGDAKAADPGK